MCHIGFKFKTLLNRSIIIIILTILDDSFENNYNIQAIIIYRLTNGWFNKLRAIIIKKGWTHFNLKYVLFYLIIEGAF